MVWWRKVRRPAFTTNDLIDLAKRQPPRNTRAFGRGEVIRHLASKPWPDLYEEHEDRQHRRMPPYVINWSVLQIRGSSGVCHGRSLSDLCAGKPGLLCGMVFFPLP